MGVCHSIILYDAEIWADSLEDEKNQKKLTAVQRTGASRVAYAYRTVCGTAAMMIATVIPIAPLARERKPIYQRRAGINRFQTRTQEGARILQEWQDTCVLGTTGRWTYRLIPNLPPWLNRQHGEVNYHVTQFLSGHGHFNAYLFRYRRRDSPQCDYCTEEDDAYHTFFACPRWAEEKTALMATLGVDLTPENAVEQMLQSETQWLSITGYIEKVLRTKYFEGSAKPLNAVFLKIFQSLEKKKVPT